MLAVTLDTSCCLDLYRGDATPDQDIVTLMRLALSGRVDVKISGVVEEEISAGGDAVRRELGLARIRTFPPLVLPAHLQGEADRLADELFQKLFPNSVSGTQTAEHNARDCRHLAVHSLSRRGRFVTLDKNLWAKRGVAATDYGIHISLPSEAVEELAGSVPAGAGIEATIAARPFQAEDEAELRRVLDDLRADYPDFDGWLTRSMADLEKTAIVVGEVDGKVAGAVIWKARGEDGRAVKLAAFRVDESARDSGLGSHLLFHALRAWVKTGVEVAYVTVSSDHAELVRFFANAGFLIQGIAPMRYTDDATEIIMGKLVLRRRITPDNLGEFGDMLTKLVFGRPGGREDPPSDDALWMLGPSASFPIALANPSRGTIELQDRAIDKPLRRLTAFDLETLFHPLVVAVPERRALLVPIKPDWADRMLSYVGKQATLYGPDSDPLLIRSDNAYYCFPRCAAEVDQRSRILFYVSTPISAVVGEAIILQAVTDYPEVLHSLFGGLGIYALPQIAGHAQKRGPRAGAALALRFGFYVPYPNVVTLRQLRRLLKQPRLTPQGLHPIDIASFEAIRLAGGLDW